MPDRSQTASRSGSDDHETDDRERDCTDPDVGSGARESHDASPDSDGSGSDDRHDTAPDGAAPISDDRHGTGPDGGGSGNADATSPKPDGDTGGDDAAAESGRFRKLDGAEYDRVDDFLDDHVAFTAREWAVTRLCADFRTGTGVPMTTVGEHLPEVVPFVTAEYTRQEVYQARRSFERKVRRAAATFLYGASAGLLAAEEVDDVLYEATEVARLLLEVEGTSLSLDEEAAVEERTVAAMRSVHEASLAVRYDECPDCGTRLGVDRL